MTDISTFKPDGTIFEFEDGSFGLTVTRGGDTTTLWLAGALDIAHATEVRAAGDFACHGTAELVIDMARLDFLDSTGIGALVAVRRKADERGVSLSVQGASARIRRVLTFTGLLDYFGLEAI